MNTVLDYETPGDTPPSCYSFCPYSSFHLWSIDRDTHIYIDTSTHDNLWTNLQTIINFTLVKLQEI
jgi:hypothetical protein